MKRKAMVKWQGNLREGWGTINTESGKLSNIPYSFGMRFETEPGTNPEELIAAAHASCFAMALSAELQKASLVAESLDVLATVELEKPLGNWAVTGLQLEVSAHVPGATQGQFQTAAEAAKTNCPISKLLKAPITMESHLFSPLPEDAQELA